MKQNIGKKSIWDIHKMLTYENSVDLIIIIIIKIIFSIYISHTKYLLNQQ